MRPGTEERCPYCKKTWHEATVAGILKDVRKGMSKTMSVSLEESRKHIEEIVKTALQGAMGKQAKQQTAHERENGDG